MQPELLFVIITGVLVGNTLTFMFGYFCFCVWRREKAGLDPLHLPVSVILCGLAPPLIGLIGAFYLKSLL